MLPSISTRRCGTFSAMTACGTPRPTTSPSITSPTATTRCQPGSPNAKPSNKRVRPTGYQGGDGVDFVAVVDQAIALLRQRGRLTYSTLQRQFQLDDAALEDVKNELIE